MQCMIGGWRKIHHLTRGLKRFGQVSIVVGDPKVEARSVNRRHVETSWGKGCLDHAARAVRDGPFECPNCRLNKCGVDSERGEEVCGCATEVIQAGQPNARHVLAIGNQAWWIGEGAGRVQIQRILQHGKRARDATSDVMRQGVDPAADLP